MRLSIFFAARQVWGEQSQQSAQAPCREVAVVRTTRQQRVEVPRGPPQSANAATQPAGALHAHALPP